MTLRRNIVLVALSVFALTGCGEGYELVKTNSYSPYSDERTAGSGYAYVRAKLLPKKDLNLKSVMTPVIRERMPVVMNVAEDVEVIETLESLQPLPPKADRIFFDDGKK